MNFESSRGYLLNALGQHREYLQSFKIYSASRVPQRKILCRFYFSLPKIIDKRFTVLLLFTLPVQKVQLWIMTKDAWLELKIKKAWEF